MVYRAKLVAIYAECGGGVQPAESDQTAPRRRREETRIACPNSLALSLGIVSFWVSARGNRRGRFSNSGRLDVPFAR